MQLKTLAGGLEEHLPCRRCDESVQIELFVVILIWMRPTMMLAAELNETLGNSVEYKVVSIVGRIVCSNIDNNNTDAGGRIE